MLWIQNFSEGSLLVFRAPTFGACYDTEYIKPDRQKAQYVGRQNPYDLDQQNPYGGGEKAIWRCP